MQKAFPREWGKARKSPCLAVCACEQRFAGKVPRRKSRHGGDISGKPAEGINRPAAAGLILIPNVNASLHRFFCPCAWSLLSQRSSATLPFGCSSHRDKIALCFGCINVIHQYNSSVKKRALQFGTLSSFYLKYHAELYAAASLRRLCSFENGRYIYGQ